MPEPPNHVAGEQEPIAIEALEAQLDLALFRATQAERERSDLREQLKGIEDYANEAWAWLDDALDALGVETVFEIQAAKAKRKQAEQG